MIERDSRGKVERRGGPDSSLMAIALLLEIVSLEPSLFLLFSSFFWGH
jgi:hypothetical protein